MSAILNAASITGKIGAGSILLADYMLEIQPIENGYRMNVTRGSEVQTMDVLDGVGIVGVEKTGSTGDVDRYRISFTDGSVFDYTIETNAAAYAAAELERVAAENGRAETFAGYENRIAEAESTAQSVRDDADAGKFDGKDAPQEAVLYTPQTLTADQQTQARENIGAADAATVNGLKDDLAELIEPAKNIVKFTQNGYVLNNNTLTETSIDYYQTSNFIHVNAGETVVLSSSIGVFIRAYVGESEESTGDGRIAYIDAFDGTAPNGRYYAAYTATQDCVLRYSSVGNGKPMAEINDTGMPSDYSPYKTALKESVIVPSVEKVIESVKDKADVIRSVNLFKADNDNGYVTIQNILTDSGKATYKTCDWIEVKIGQKIIVSSEMNFCRIYVGINTLPTTSGGYRVAYITEFTGTAADGRKYVSYTATQDCYVRASVYYKSIRSMVEITDADEPSSYVEYGDKLDPSLRVLFAEKADGLTDKAKEELIASFWYGKNVIVIGDSLTAAGIWQKKMNTVLGMNVTTHAKGGIGFPAMLDGSADSTDPETQASGSLAPLTADDVKDKDLIVIFGGYNHRGSADGAKGDLYPTVNSTYGCLQYLINGVYGKLAEAGNLKCRVAIVTPHCAGKYSYIPYDWNSEYPAGSGRTGETLINAIKDCAADNRLPCLDLFHNSGINDKTWNVFSLSDSPVDSSGNVRDQLHLNAQVGYPYLGDVIARWVNTQ